MPMRASSLWSEALLNASTKDEQQTGNEENKSHTKFSLVPRNMHDSYCEVVLPFSSSSQLLENYTNASGGIRTGKYVCPRGFTVCRGNFSD